MKKLLVVLALAVACGLALAACSDTVSPENAGLDKAYERLTGTSGLGEEGAFAYDEATDALTVDLGKVSDVDKFFEVMNKTVNGGDVGTLILNGATSVDPSKLSAGLANLSCKSLKCLDMGASRSDGIAEALEKDDSWTALLAKTEALFDPDVYVLSKYGSDALENVANVKAIWADAEGDMDGENTLEIMKGVEEIRFTTGLTTESREENEKQGLKVGDSDRLLKSMPYMESLDRVLVLPESDSYEPGVAYCKFIILLQDLHLGLKTNVPGEVWDGSEDSLVSVDDIDVLSISDDEKVVDELERALNHVAKDAFETGKSFTLKDGTPKLDGTCLVYMGDPHDSQFGNYDKFFDLTHISFITEFDGTKIKTMRSAGEHFDYFVYIYPTFTQVGTYGDTTEAYNTEVNVRIYDMNNEEKYESGIIKTVEAPSQYYYSGSPAARYWPNIDKEAALAYVEGLA